MSRLSQSARSWYTTSMPSALACLGAVTCTWAPSNSVLPGVEWMDSRHSLDEGALAGAVVADERGHLARVDVEVHVLQHVDGAEALVNFAQLKDWRAVAITVPSCAFGMPSCSTSHERR